MLSFAYQKDLIETGEEKGFVSPGVPTEWVEVLKGNSPFQ
jgi:hypothetical protein